VAAVFVPVSDHLSRISRNVLPCRFLFPVFSAVPCTLAPLAAHAGGPRYIAGTSNFDPGVIGQPVHWAGGQLNYSVDQGPLNGGVSNQQATAMVDAAVALWSAVPTAGVILSDKAN
jgi:hypothetical protein